MAAESVSSVFQFLATTRNQAALDCLAGLLESPDTQISWQAAAAMTARSEQQAIETFLGAFKSDAEYSKYRHWKPLGHRLKSIIGQVVENSSHPLYRQALVAIVECELVERFHILVRAAEQIGSPHGSFAARLLINLARSVVESDRQSGSTSAMREELLRVLISSTEQFAKHRSQIIVEALLISSVPEDAHIYSAINEPDGKLMKLFTKVWRTTQRVEVVELLVQLAWKHYIPKPMQDIFIHERKDSLLIKSIAKCTREGVTEHILERLSMSGIPTCCLELKADDQSIPLSDRYYCYLLMAQAKAPFKLILEGIIKMSLLSDSTAESMAASVLRQAERPSIEGWIKILSQEQGELYEERRKLKKNGKSTESSAMNLILDNTFETKLKRLIESAYRSDGPFKQSAMEYFRQFSCDCLVKEVDEQVEGVLTSLARIIRFAHTDWASALLSHLHLPNAKQRCNAVIAASYFGYDRTVHLELERMVNDENKVVREEVQYALNQKTENI